MAAIRDDIKDRVQQATDIVRLIGEQVALRPKGKEFVGLCPFHDDKNPSMQVSPVKQIYKCFSCGAGGDVFSFVMNYHKMSFPEAIRHLAERAGIQIEAGDGRWQMGEGEKGSERKRIAAANVLALEFYRTLLKHPDHGGTARDYIDRRGISAEMVAEFQLGYAPDRWDGLVQMIRSKGWDSTGFELAGLVSPRDTGGLYDRMRHRLIFPIFDAIGRPIAFGGRKLREEDEPKYLNSPETRLFNKSATLYGLHLAKKPIIDSKTAVIVEGYTDVIACHQAGARNVVATLGTALTSEHVTELRRYAEKVVLIFDADEAGQKAADRAVELFLTGDLDVFISVLPDGLDPADLLALPDGRERWDTALSHAKDAMSYLFDRLHEQMAAAGTLTGRQHLAESFVTRLAQLGLSRVGTLRRALVVQRLSHLLGVSEQAVNALVADRMRTARRPQPPESPSETVAGGSENRQNSPDGVPEESVSQSFAPAETRRKLKALALAERQIIGCLIRDNQRFESVLSDGRPFDEAVTSQEFIHPQSKALYQRLYQRLSEGQSVTLTGLLADLASEGNQNLADLLTQAEAEVEAQTAGLPQREQELMLNAARALVAYHRELQYQQARQALSGGDPAESEANGATDEMRIIRQMLEHRRDHPSPVRIARTQR
ncbi:MAG: hypothetical protein Kow00105_12110 [Phycisphaeraceae bacterium]